MTRPHEGVTQADYWDLIEAALTALPETNGLRAPALAAFDHLKERVLAPENRPAWLKGDRG